MPMRGTSRFSSDTRENERALLRDTQMDRGKGRDDARGRERDRYNERERESETDNLPDVAKFYRAVWNFQTSCCGYVFFFFLFFGERRT
jgi:hypothetical protein